jgi:SAM-dependent methyltransferase
MSGKRPCPVCGTRWEASDVFLKAHVDAARLNEYSYASRKMPEYMNHGLVRCIECDLVFANDPPHRSDLAEAYHSADFDSSEEANDAAVAYVEVLRPIIERLASRQSALEIGTGTGVLLEHLRSLGFDELVGIEPSAAAIRAAAPHRRQWIREGVFEEQDFEPASFDLICCFMTMEHVLDPKVVASAALNLLRPGGAFVTVTHNYRSPVNRALGKRSPIIDIEHMQLFSDRSVRELFERVGFSHVEVASFTNRYALSYWWRLAPAPGGLKARVASILQRGRLGRTKIGLRVGNTVTSGIKP